MINYLGFLSFSTGVRRELDGWIGQAVKGYAATVAIWTTYQATLSSIDVLALSIIFLSLMLVLVFVLIGSSSTADKTTPSAIDFILATCSLIVGIYFVLSIPEISTRISLFTDLSSLQRIFSVLIILLTLEATRRTVGAGLMVIVILFIFYNLYGDYFEGPLRHGEITLDHFLDISVFTSDGLFGIPIRVAATYAFVFVMFGTFLEKAKGGDFFFNIAALISGKSPGGPAKVAVFSSALFGTVSGSPTSDVVTTGSITIPMMKRLGYSGTLAGAVEVAASTGGSLLPPIMGSAAFIMAEFTGIPYSQIIIAALIPALLYYLGVYIQVHLRSLKLGLNPMQTDSLPNLKETLAFGWVFLVPLIAMIIALVKGYSPTYVAVFGTLALIVVSQFKKDTRITVKSFHECLAATTIRMVSVTGACAAAGLVIGGITMTGLATKFSYFVFLFSENNVFPALVCGAILTIILGLGMPTPSAYILAAVLIGPVFVNDIGIPILSAHLFLLYYAVMSAMTPPVAVAAYAASAIADANPLSIALNAVVFSIVAFFVPFSFIFNQELLLLGSISDIIFVIVSVTCGVIFIAIGSEGYLFSSLPFFPRLLFFTGGFCTFVELGWITVVGLVIGFLLIYYLKLKKKSSIIQ